MKKIIKNVVLLSTFIFILASCSHPLIKDPRLYNKKENNEKPVFPSDDDTIISQDTTSPFDDESAWFNNPNSNGDDTAPNKVGFSNEEFNTMALTGIFDIKNIPSYTMKKQDVWGKCTNELSNEYVQKNAPATEGQGFNITDVAYYQYRGKNPCYSPEGNYNKDLQTTSKGNPQLNRFYFYRFTGKGGGIQKLDNYLIAVDTYSKFIFAFSKPVTFNGLGAPTSWAPTDKKSIDGIVHQFYYYDPVGYIVKNPDNTYTVQLYSWFKENISNKNYESTLNKDFNDIARKTPEGAGRSPFYVEKSKATSFVENIQGKSFSYREADGYTGSDGKGFGKSLYTIEFSNDGKTAKLIESIWNGSTANIFEAHLLSETDMNNAIYTKTGNNKENINFSLTNDNSKIIVNNNTYYYNFASEIDLGPSFVNRLDYNSIFKPKLSKNSYNFSKNNNDLIYKSNKSTINYNFVSEHARSIESAQAVYIDNEGKYWGVQIGDNGNKLSLSGEGIPIIDGVEVGTNKGVATIEDINWNFWHYTALKQ